MRRSRRDAWYETDSRVHPMHWLQKLFAEVNNGRNPEFTLPQKIEVLVPEPVLSSSDYSFQIIDTRGISQDSYAARQDLESHFDDPHTIVMLCSTFLQAPEVNVQTLLRRAKEAGLKDVESKTILLVLPHGDEASKVKDNAGSYVETDEEGYELKSDVVNLSLAQMGFGQITTLFFNSKQDAPAPIVSAILEQVKTLRRIYSARITQMVQAVDLVIENYEKEEVRAVFEEVGRRLTTWLESHRELGWDGLAVQEPLITAIDNTRYAATVRAAVRRKGDWSNLDYYHHLGFGARRIAAMMIGKHISEFKVIHQNLVQDDQLSHAHMFLNGVLERLEHAVDEVYKRMQFTGSEVFKTDVERDYEFWGRCEGRWGGGPGYRDAIRGYTDNQFKSHYDDAHLRIEDMINREWGKILALLNEMLRDGGEQIDATSAVELKR